MNWFYGLIVFQYTILLLHGRPDTSSTSTPEKITLEMEYPSSIPAIITSLGNGATSEIAGAELKSHLSTTVSVSPPASTTKRGTTTVKKIDATKKTTKQPELVTFSTAVPSMEAIAKTTRVIDELSNKQKPMASTTTTTTTTMTRASTSKTDPSTVTTISADKPTIYEIITETEKNQTQFTSRSQPFESSTLSSSPLALALSSQLPAQNQRSSDTPKAIGHHVEMHQNNGHPGIAEPLTWQQLESEMSMVDQNLKESSTSKDGISTWILLSGSDKQQQMLPTPATTTVSHVEKFDVQDKLNDRPNFRFGEVHNDKIAKPTKVRDVVENKKPKPDKKQKMPSTTMATKPTPLPSSTSGILLASDFMSDKNRRKTPLAVANKVNKRKITTTTTSTEAAIVSSEKVNEAVTAEEVEITTPVSFIELEPKDANFDLPQDRSPATKKPQKPKPTKRKPSKKNKVTSVTKSPTKVKEKPISTTIYNYLSREVMPSVGILGAGILLTAGLASYIFGPFGALRRSYDDASDRQDNVDNIYSVNNEEYAVEGTEGGQHEEEVFSKFLAGMPYRDVPRYVKYFKPDGAHPNQQMPTNYPYRQPNVRLQSQATNTAPKYAAYSRYRMAPSPHYNPAQYNPQYPNNYRNHQQSTQPATQPQVISPVYNPQYHEMQKQKSFANNMDSVLKHQSTIYGQSVTSSNINALAQTDRMDDGNVVEEKSVGTDILAESGGEIAPQAESLVSEVTENQQTIDDESMQLQRRTNTYVVGSTITDTQNGEAIVSASMTASVDGFEPTKRKGIVENVEPGVITVTASSHGPRRRRRRNTESVTQNSTQETTIKTTVHEKSDISSTTTITPSTEAPMQITRLYSSSEYSNLVSEYNMLNEKIMSFDRDYNNEEKEKKVEKKIQIEFKSITTDYDAFRKAIDGAKAIEQFEKQAHIRAKNYELSIVLKTGMTTLYQRIKQLNDLVEHPEDDRIIEKINRRDGSNASNSNVSSNTNSTTSKEPENENGFVGFLKLLQLKAQFGLNILQNIRPSFERAFEEVFKRPYEKPN